MADYFEANSSDQHYNPTFIEYKNRCEQEYLRIENNLSPINEPFTLRELTPCIKELKNNRCPGPDTITFEMIKHLPIETIEVLLNIYNYIWQNHIYPEQWKKVITVPIAKSNRNKNNVNNYRPIAISNTLNNFFRKW